MIFQMCFYFGIVGVCLDHARVAIFVDSNLFWQRATLTPIQHHKTSNRGGALLEAARTDNDGIYPEVDQSGLGVLYCLGAEVFGRWGAQSVQLVPALARERCRGVHVRL